MFLNFQVVDASARVRGGVRMRLNWDKKTWEVDQDPQAAWKALSKCTTGTFQPKSQAMWLLDEYSRNPAILWGTPRGPLDLSAQTGSGRLYQPADQSLRESQVTWKLEPSSTAAATVPSGSSMRDRLVERLRELLPCSIGGTEIDPRNKSLTKWKVVSCDCQRFAGTSCGSLPGFVSVFLGAEPLKNGKTSGIKAFNEYLKQRSLNGTNKVRERGIKFGAWVEAGNDRRPQKGDIYALLDRNEAGEPLMDKKNSNVGHVGVILDASGTEWVTADLGQGTGFDGKIDLKRNYKVTEGQLYGEVLQKGKSPYRVVAGWVDIEKYFAS